jgi:transcriptional regulator with PAS, ATPase and Fis domain
LQEKEIKPLGDTRTVEVDVRIISSTNRNLKEKIKKTEFRQDFFYRLNVLPLELPPLREHREDIPLIANHLLEKHNIKLEKSVNKISTELMEIFMQRTWEGNVRELENLIMQGILFSSSDEITPRDVGFKKNIKNNGLTGRTFQDAAYKDAKEQVLKQFNANFIGNLLTMNKGNVTQAARLCGLERQALQQIMRRYGIKAEPFRK